MEPSALLEASKVSKHWRAATLDSRLWKQKYLAEGWALDRSEVTKFEDNYFSHGLGRKRGSRKAHGQDGEPSAKKRTMRQENFLSIGASTSGRRSQGFTAPTPIPTAHTSSHDEEMRDAEALSPADNSGSTAPSEGTTSSMWPEPRSIDGESVSERPFPASSSDLELELDDPLVFPASDHTVKVNFHHVYKQRRRLEANWAARRFENFQFPHKDHPEEAHSECVYTVQFSGKHLVSGSRDRTIRIWDLETQRQVRRPLDGHNGSVLCLQFDERPHEDVIISGSSDTDVIVWQFSTGKLIKRISKAHNESVLNLKFDHRYLVTCSKDKMIKVWNRRALRPGDDSYPIRGAKGGAKFPVYVLDLSQVTSVRDMENYFTPDQLAPIPQYSLIMRIDSHSAAVNAVFIHGDELVSASGDRDVKVFNIRTGADAALCKGHVKGIACVQYDGKRIVSGSSDDSIRIFDPVSQLEVACLQGHDKLVRTVQATFGDQPGAEEDLEQEARKVDQAFIEARRMNEIPANTSRQRISRNRNAGSHRPEDIMAVGAKLPPGGGGSRWARIVSGSYDETVIIWRKAKDGRWVVGHRLRQADALKASGGPLLARSERVAQTVALQQAQQAHLSQATQMAAQHAAQMGHLGHTAASSSASAAGPSANITTTIQLAANTIPAAQAGNSNVPMWSHQVSYLCIPEEWQAYKLQGLSLQNQPVQNGQLQNSYQQVLHQNPGPHPPPAQPAVNGPVPNVPLTMAVPYPMAVQHHPQNARVFKLQFDARRIICCSQDPKIVGWDFANGDEDIIECSKFFGPPE